MQQEFYSSLPVHAGSIGSLIIQENLFINLPASWRVVVTDIKGSSGVVFQGGHKLVNLIATGSIVCVLNIAAARKIAVPFFFGGDGATFLIPENIAPEIFNSLSEYSLQIRENHEVEIRVGSVPVSRIYNAGESLKISRYQYSRSYVIPVILGHGLQYAENLIKEGPRDSLSAARHPADVMLDGLQCRWDVISAPIDKDEVVTFLIAALPGTGQAPAFKGILDKLDEVYGDSVTRQPITVRRLRLSSTLGDAAQGMLIRMKSSRWLTSLKKRWLIILGYIFFRTNRGKHYLKTLTESADTLVLDGRINTVISGRKVQREAMVQFLNKLESDGLIIYGMDVSTASIMSCYVPDLTTGHIHFVDGHGGGYTKAAKMLKSKSGYLFKGGDQS